MSTFEHDAVIVTLANRASIQVRDGLAALQAGKLLEAEVQFRAAHATLSSLAILLETPQPPAKPMRKIALVRSPSGEHVEDTMPEWFHTKKGGPDGAA